MSAKPLVHGLRKTLQRKFNKHSSYSVKDLEKVKYFIETVIKDVIRPRWGRTNTNHLPSMNIESLWRFQKAFEVVLGV